MSGTKNTSPPAGSESASGQGNQAGNSGWVRLKEMTSDRDPVEEPLDVVKEEKIYCIVVSAHKGGSIEQALFGGGTMPLSGKWPF